jgi:O-acetyl-ADP-ribose deacetylase (regulator of RNase III)
MQVHVAQADITNLPVDAIVNPANSRGEMGGGLSATIVEFGGDEIQIEARAAAPIAVGAAVVTTAGQLPARAVIHAPTVEEPGQRTGPEQIRRAARAALLACAAKGYNVIAIPGMGAGAGGVPAEDVARAIVEEIRSHRKPHPETIYLVDTRREMVEAFEEALRQAQSTM